MEQVSIISRREFFKASIFIGSSIVFNSCFRKIQENFQDKGIFLVLNQQQRHTLRAFLEVLIPETNQIEEVFQAVIRRMDEELYFVDSEISESFQDALYFAEWYPFIQYKTIFSRLSSLNKNERLSFIQDSIQNQEGIVRTVYSNIKMVVYYVYYGLEYSWKDIGYDGPFGKFREKPFEMRAYYKEKIS